MFLICHVVSHNHLLKWSFDFLFLSLSIEGLFPLKGAKTFWRKLGGKTTSKIQQSLTEILERTLRPKNVMIVNYLGDWIIWHYWRLSDIVKSRNNSNETIVRFVWFACCQIFFFLILLIVFLDFIFLSPTPNERGFLICCWAVFYKAIVRVFMKVIVAYSIYCLNKCVVGWCRFNVACGTLVLLHL